jgi:hypothetical protein
MTVCFRPCDGQLAVVDHERDQIVREYRWFDYLQPGPTGAIEQCADLELVLSSAMK